MCPIIATRGQSWIGAGLGQAGCATNPSTVNNLTGAGGGRKNLVLPADRIGTRPAHPFGHGSCLEAVVWPRQLASDGYIGPIVFLDRDRPGVRTRNARPGVIRQRCSQRAHRRVLRRGGGRCSANVGAWNGRENKESPSFVVPVKVRIKKPAGVESACRYERLLAGRQEGRSYRPVPVLPMDADARKRIPKLARIYAASKFFVAPGFHDVYATLEPWTAPLERDDELYERLFRRWGKQPPALDVLRVALPEGVLDDGGVVTGYLFFESPLDKEDRVTFEATFGGGDGQTTVASIEIHSRSND